MCNVLKTGFIDTDGLQYDTVMNMNGLFQQLGISEENAKIYLFHSIFYLQISIAVKKMLIEKHQMVYTQI